MSTLQSYDLNGKKLSFANWISTIAPIDTPFSSMTGKEATNQTIFQWQTDNLAVAGRNVNSEGDDAVSGNVGHTDTKSNMTQILRKVISISDTANATENYGRTEEVKYQLENAAEELKRDIEWALLNNELASDETDEHGRMSAGFAGLVAPLGAVDFETGAIVHQSTGKADGVFEDMDIFNIIHNLYIAGSETDIIMFHPKWASYFSALQERPADGGKPEEASRRRIFENTPKLSVYVSTLVDMFGATHKLVVNRWMPEEKIFFFKASDFTQMLLRPPSRVKLAKDGSYEKWMIEAELGLRLSNPFAAGILDTTDNVHIKKDVDVTSLIIEGRSLTDSTEIDMLGGLGEYGIDVPYVTGDKLSFKIKKYKKEDPPPPPKPDPPAPSGKADTAESATWNVVSLYKDGVYLARETITSDKDTEFVITSVASSKNVGNYLLILTDSANPTYKKQSKSVYFHMKG
jgi:hypothetical protein